MYIEFPPPERMREIVRMHHPGANENMVKAAIEIFYQLRELNLTRKPSTGEILDWIAYLVRENIQSLKDIERLKGAQTLVKHRDDRELLQLIQEKGISSASQVKSGRWKQEDEQVHEEWQKRGLSRGKLRKHVMKMMGWDNIPEVAVDEILSQIREKISS
jgi:MoxR-like ATPase